MYSFKNKKILVTGGATGIGAGIVNYLLEKEGIVTICGRRMDVLLEMKKKLQISIIQCDLSIMTERESLINSNDFDVVINNAGIQKSFDLTKDDVNFSELDQFFLQLNK